MKTKYYGLVSVAVLFLTLLACAYYLQIMTETKGGYLDQANAPKMPEISYPSDKEMEPIHDLQKKLALLSFPRGSDAKVDLRLFGDEPHTGNAGNFRGKDRTDDLPDFYYSISFAFVSGANRFCSIDGKFYSEGDILPDGARVATVETDRVLISKQYTSEWVPVTSRGNDSEKAPENSTHPTVSNQKRAN